MVILCKLMPFFKTCENIINDFFKPLQFAALTWQIPIMIVLILNVQEIMAKSVLPIAITFPKQMVNF